MDKKVVVIAKSDAEHTSAIFWVRNILLKVRGAKSIEVIGYTQPSHQVLKRLHDQGECRYFFIISGQIRCGQETVLQRLFSSMSASKVACICVSDLLGQRVPELLEERVVSYSGALPGRAKDALLEFVGSARQMPSQGEKSGVNHKMVQVLSATG